MWKERGERVGENRGRGGGAGPMTREDLRKGQQERVRKKRKKKREKKLEAEKNGEREIKLREVAGRVAVIPTAYYSHRPVNRAEKNMHGGCGGRKEQH